MGNRKQPFGYRMTLGEITIQPEEAELVRFIFQGYSTGATLGELTKALCRQEIPYYEGRTWNKNTEPDAELLQSVVSKVRITNKCVTVTLKNGQTIERRDQL